VKSIAYTSPAGTITLSDAGTSIYGITSLTGLGPAELNIQSQKSPFQDGTTPIDRLFNPREVVLNGIITVGQNNLQRYTYRRTMCQYLNAKYGVGSLVYTNTYGAWALTNVEVEGPTFANKNSNEGCQTYQIVFHAHDPYFYDVSSTTVTITTGTGITNSGDVNAPIKLTITGPCTNPIVTNNTTGYYIKYIGSLSSSQYLVVTTATGNKRVTLYTSGVASNAISSIYSGSTLWGLNLGANSVTRSADSGTPVTTVAYYNKYIGA
jgi:hypothetical protein